jgi:hypothetical protein
MNIRQVIYICILGKISDQKLDGTGTGSNSMTNFHHVGTVPADVLV